MGQLIGRAPPALALVMVGVIACSNPDRVLEPNAAPPAEAAAAVGNVPLGDVDDGVTDVADRVLASLANETEYADLRAALHRVIAAARAGDLEATDGSITRATRALAAARAESQAGDDVRLELDAVEIALAGSQRIVTEIKSRPRVPAVKQ